MQTTCASAFICADKFGRAAEPACTTGQSGGARHVIRGIAVQSEGGCVQSGPCADVRTCKVGSLTFVLANKTGFPGGPVNEGASIAPEDWELLYLRPGTAAAGNADARLAPTVQFHAASLGEKWKESGHTMLVRFPRAAFKGLEDHLDAICAGRVEFVASPLLIAYLDSLLHYVPLLSVSEQLVVEAVTKQLVQSCIMRTGEKQANAARPASRSRLESAKRYIDERISSPSLTVENLQAWLGVSRRQLYSLFEGYGGVARYILRQRLRKCHSAISNPLEGRPFGRIAEQFGVDPTRLDSLFRKEFGYGPDGARWNANRMQDQGGSDALFAARGACAA